VVEIWPFPFTLAIGFYNTLQWCTSRDVSVIVLDEDDTDHIVSVQLDDEESMAQFLDSHNPDDVSCGLSNRPLLKPN